MRILCLRLQPFPPVAVRWDLDLRHLADLEEFSPLIGLVDRRHVCLDIGGTAGWFGGEQALLDHLRQWCHERRLQGTAGIAATLGAAWGLVDSLDDSVPFIGRSWRTEQTIAALSSLPVKGLRLPHSVLCVLHELGLDQIGQVLDFSRDDLAERFEPILLLRLDQALGVVPELVEPYRPEPIEKVELTWEFGIADSDLLTTAWERLLPELLGPLVARGRGVARILAELIGETGSLCRLVVGLMRPTIDRRHLLDLLRLRLESVRLAEPLVGTRLTVLEEAPQAIQQQVLFAELAPPTESHAWASLVERLAGRLGSDRVVRIGPHADHDPGRAWKASPWVRRSAHARKPHKEAVAPHSLLRPTLLLAKPQSIQVFAIAPQGHPQRFRDRRGETVVTQSWGPERIETGWWRGPSLRRDYYRVETESGSQAWIFRDLRTRRWFLHGWFD